MPFQPAEHPPLLIHVMKLCNATAHGERRTDECKYQSLPAVSAHLTEGAAVRKENAKEDQGADNLELSTPWSMTVILHAGQIEERKQGKLQSAEHTVNPPLSQVMTGQGCQMSRCGETCGKTSELNSERGGRKNSQTDM